MANLVWFDSSETGIPVMNNVPGSFIAVLDACLVNGFNNKSVTNIVVSSGAATVNCTSHGYTATFQKPVEIAGCTETTLNGQKEVLTTTTDNFTFSAPSTPDGTYGGTITAKRPSLGWVKAFSGTNKAIYQRTDISATTNLLRVDNNLTSPGSTTANYVCMLETATDIDTYTRKVPVSDSHCLWSNSANDATAKTWAIVGDSKRIFVLTRNGSATNNTHHTYFFGDPDFLKPSDSYGCLMINHNGVNMTTTGSGLFNNNATLTGLSSYTATTSIFSRNYSGSISPAPAYIKNLIVTFSTSYPSAVSEPTILLGPYYLTDFDGVRAKLNYYVASTYQPHGHLVVVQPDNEPYRFLAIRQGAGSTSASEAPSAYIRLEGWS